jgi:serine/threonine protein kinase
MADLADGTVVAQIYRVQEHLGGGGFGETYLAENTTLPGNQVVAKTVASPDQGLEEAQTLVSLQSANVVRVLAFDARSGRPEDLIREPKRNKRIVAQDKS